MVAYLGASSASHSVIPIAVVVALISAIATLVVSLSNLRFQKKALQWQQDEASKQMDLQRSALQWQRDHASRQIDLMQSGQITDRFLRGIEHLGDSSQQVRIGAVFALERIANESPSDRAHIVSTLAALVRDRLPASGTGVGEYVDVLMVRRPDAQAALTALCRSPLSDDRRDSAEIGGLDLSRTDLRRARLRNANLRGANLWGSRLEGANLAWADLSDSNLGNANFGSIQPGNPDFRGGTDLRHAKLAGARLKGAHNFDVALTEGAIGLTDDLRNPG